MDYQGFATQLAGRYGIPSDLFLKQINAESAWNPSAVSPAGALGLAQLMPSTAKELGVDPLDWRQNLEGGARYLKQQYDRFGNWDHALAAYNAGPNRVEQYGGIPPFEETQNYVAKIMGGDMAYTDQPTQQGGLLSMPEPSRGDKRRDMAGRAAMFFNELRQRPSAAIPQMVQGRRDERKSNRTAEWLRQQPGGEQFAAMIDAGATGAQALASYQASIAAKPTVKGVAVDGRLINPITGEVMYEPEAAGYDPKALTDLRKEFVGLRPVKEFSDQSSAYGRVLASADNPSAAGDLALIFNYMKVLDPGSTVREGEFATAQNSGGVDSRARALYNSVIDGTRLDASQRADFVGRAGLLYQNAEQQFTNLRGQYSTIATQQGLPVDLALPSFAYSGEIPEIVSPPIPNPADTGIVRPESVSVEDWEYMTPEERELF